MCYIYINRGARLVKAEAQPGRLAFDVAVNDLG
jgi:hypothetical protein